MHGIELDTYEPTDIDLTFTKRLMDSLRIGGIWAIPRCALKYQKDSETTIKLIGYLKIDDEDEVIRPHVAADLKMAQAMDHHALKACCEKLGFEVDESILETSPADDDSTLEQSDE